MQDFAVTKSDEHFAPTPTDETTRIIEACALQKGFKMRTADVSDAFLHADEEERVIVRPPKEWQETGKIWLLLKALYGRRTAPKNWNQKLTTDLMSLGVESCDAQPSLFFSREKQIAIEVHVDDFDIAGPDDGVVDAVAEDVLDEGRASTRRKLCH